MKKPVRDHTLFSPPQIQTILGTHLQERPNFMALAWTTRVNYLPPLIGIAVNKKNASHTAVLDTGEFSVNIPSRKMIEITDYCGMISATQSEKSEIFEVFYGELKAAPMIRDCPLNIECRLTQSVDLPTHAFFIGEIIKIFAEETFLTDGIPDMAKIEPFLLTMPDNLFWSLGETVGNAWHDGREILKRVAKTREL